MCKSNETRGWVKRTCRCYDNGDGRGWVLELTFEFARRSAVQQIYFFRPVRSDWGTAAYEVTKPVLDGDEVYHVILDGMMSACDCRGFEAHAHCRHLDALLALAGKGKLPQLLAEAV